MNQKRNSTIITAVVSGFITFAVTALCFIIFIMPSGGNTATQSFIARLYEIDGLIDGMSIRNFDRETALDNALYAYVATLDDEYATYFDKDYYEEYINEVHGNYTGIGAQVSYPEQGIVEPDGLFILRIIGNSPAEAAGLLAADRIIAVDGKDIIGMNYNDAVGIITGEADTDVSLKIKRGDEIFSITVTRSKFASRDVDFHIINGDIGFVRIHEFNSDTTYPQFESALNELLSEGVKGFIFDVRNNPGGDYNTVVNMLNLLVPKDELVVLKYKDREEIDYSSGDRKTDLPSVVIMNGSSASAAELFSSALRDLNSSPLIGNNSYGKGVGQGYFNLSDGAGIKFTTFNYMTKSRVDYDGVGLKPDYEVSLDSEQYKNMYALSDLDDPQIIKAIEVINSIKQ